MATVGDVLTAPDSGWKRIDDDNMNFQYNGTWTDATGVSYYNGTRHYTFTSGDNIKFNFTGDKIRIITVVNSNATSDVTVSIDGVEENISLYNSTQQFQTIVYEKTNLEDKEHWIALTHNVEGEYFTIDAIDISDSGEVKSYQVVKINKILISSTSGDIVSSENDGTNDILKYIPSQTEQDFINHGIDGATPINPQLKYNFAGYVNNTSTTLGNGKVFEQPIDKYIKSLNVK